MSAGLTPLVELLFVLALAPGPAKADAAPAPVLDSRITEQVYAKLAQDQELARDKIRVATRNGVVHMRGTVPSTEAAKRAIRLAEAAPGVKGVWVDFVAE